MGYGCPISASSLEAMSNVGDDRSVRLAYGRSFVNKASAKDPGIAVGAKGNAVGAVHARELAAKAAWFKHRAQVCCSNIPLGGRTARRFSTAGAAFLYGVWGWGLYTEVWRLSNKLGGRCLGAMKPRHIAQGPLGTSGHWPPPVRLGPVLAALCSPRCGSHMFVYTWAGDVARAPSDQPFAAVTRWRSLLGWHTVQTIAVTSEDWCHTRTNRHRGSNDTVTAVLGPH